MLKQSRFKKQMSREPLISLLGQETRVYIYDLTGIKATFPLKQFRGIK